MRYYAGIGSRKTPPEILEKMTQYAVRLSKIGFILRSGGAPGADAAFEKDLLPGMKEIIRAGDSTGAAEDVAKTIHPAWHVCNDYVKRLHGRNCQIILGKDLDFPVNFVILWSQNTDRGGTRTGAMLAARNGIQVYNLALRDSMNMLDQNIDYWERNGI